MKNESGRTLMETLGVLAISGILAAAAFQAYRVVQTRQSRFIAEDNIRSISTNARILFAGRQSFENISADYMIRAGGMKSAYIGIGGDIRMQSNAQEKSFTITIPEITESDCVYFTMRKFDFVDRVGANGYYETSSSYCKPDSTNEISFIIK
ncbi:MAG: type II secretion system GspH family protein [Rickettsiales bacterium]|jgi:Tfp pilus assembly protein PilE|nr:type II secretion system GspH family protein [Rickettsiales bacterium]